MNNEKVESKNNKMIKDGFLSVRPEIRYNGYELAEDGTYWENISATGNLKLVVTKDFFKKMVDMWETEDKQDNGGAE